MIFKAVVLLSKFSFFISSLSFVVSFMLGIKVLLLNSGNNRRSNDNTRVEVVHVPLQQKYPQTYTNTGWSDRVGDSRNKFIPLSPTHQQQQHYEKTVYEEVPGGQLHEHPYYIEPGLPKDSYQPL